MTQTTISSLNVHLTDPSAEVSTKARIYRGVGNLAPYASVGFTFGAFDLTLYPGEKVGDLADSLEALAAKLREIADELAEPKALVLED